MYKASIMTLTWELAGEAQPMIEGFAFGGFDKIHVSGTVNLKRLLASGIVPVSILTIFQLHIGSGYLLVIHLIFKFLHCEIIICDFCLIYKGLPH